MGARAAACQSGVAGAPPGATLQSDGDQQRFQAGESMETVKTLTSVLPIPAEFMRFVSSQDLEEVKRITGCDSRVAEPKGEGADWTIVLYGSSAAREQGHRFVEEMLSSKLAAEMEAS